MRQRGFTQPVIVLTASGGIDTVVQAMQAGAQDFLVKPAAPERIAVSIRNALKLGELQGEVKRLTKRAAGQVTFDDLIGGLVGHDPHQAAGRRGAAKSSIPILILGESGGRQGVDRPRPARLLRARWQAVRGG